MKSNRKANFLINLAKIKAQNAKSTLFTVDVNNLSDMSQAEITDLMTLNSNSKRFLSAN